MTRALVAGAGGFIGGHLVKSLLDDGIDVRAVDIKQEYEWYQSDSRAENLTLDLRELNACRKSVEGVQLVFNLAADMGGMGFIENNRALCMLSVLINTHLLKASLEQKIEKYFFAPSACVYASNLQTSSNNPGLRETDAYPALPEDGYGWEKLFSERMCRHFLEDFGLETRVARFHNVYGPYGTWEGGREKAPAAICRKIAEAKLRNLREIQVWGDGSQSRSFMWIDDCITGIRLLMNSNHREPINLGSNELVTINELVSLVESIAEFRVNRIYQLNAPKGVQGRNSDNTRIREVLNWQPDTRLEIGLRKTFSWIYSQVQKRSIVK